jgi:type II secretory pathway pseudopilin PulG
MTGHTADRERVWTDTQEWLDDLDRDRPDADVNAPAADLGAPGADDGSGAPMNRSAANGAGSADDELAYDPADYYDRAAHTTGVPVDLDNSGPDPAGADAEAPDPADRHNDDTEPPSDSPADTNPSAELAQTHAPVADDSAAQPPRYNKTIAVGFAIATAVATLAVSGALLAMRGGTRTAEQDHTTHPSTQVSVIAAPTTNGTAAGNSDSTIPYTATSVGCLPGSTAAQSVAGPDSTQAWVCVHGGNVGQYLVLNLGRSMVITAVSITPGWVGADASGADQWQQHRVVTRVQWSFNDSPPTVVPQDTGSVHGEAAKPMPGHGVLASGVIMLVQQTARAPADTTPTTSPAPPQGGLFGEVLGPPVLPAEPAPTSTTAPLPGLPADQSRTDPADNTFAVSAIKIFGHPPQ